MCDAAKVMQAYSQIDQQISEFQAATQLQCPAGCGRCCENPYVETTLLEMVPLAVELFRRGEAVEWFNKAAEANELNKLNEPSACLFYKPDPLIPGNGRCQVYFWRPAVCRLFGYATVTDREGQPAFAACVRHKAEFPEVIGKIQEAIANGLPAPSFALSQQIAHLAPHLSTQRMPIYQALKAALEWVGLNLQLEQN